MAQLNYDRSCSPGSRAGVRPRFALPYSRCPVSHTFYPENTRLPEDILRKHAFLTNYANLTREVNNNLL